MLGALVPRGRPLPSRLLEVISLAASFAALADPRLAALGPILRGLIFTHGLWTDARKPDRVFDALVAIAAKLHESAAEKNDYVRKDEFKDLFEETLRRLSDQPDPARREWLRHILLKVMDDPKDHAENRLFLRLVDELSTDAHKLLSILNTAVTEDERHLARDEILARRAGTKKDQVVEHLDELARAGLLDRNQFNGPGPPAGIGYDYFFTRLGREFLAYRGGTGQPPNHRS